MEYLKPEIKEIPNSLYWGLKSDQLANKQYLKHLNFIKENMAINYITITPGGGLHLQNLKQCHGVIAEIVDYAHKIGLKISLRLLLNAGFFNAAFITDNHPAIDQAQLFHIPDPQKAEAIVNDIELTLDDARCAKYTHEAVWGRSKIAPIYAEILKAFCFEKTEDGFYAPESLRDVTEQIQVTNARTNMTEFEIDLGEENKGKTVFVLLAQYYNSTAISDAWSEMKELIDAYSDIPLDGVTMDEFGYLFLNAGPIQRGEEPPFRGRIYSRGMKSYYAEDLGLDLDRLLFDMRYAPEGCEEVRIKAINTYFEVLRRFPLEIEKKVYHYAKYVFGKGIYVSCHNTFHNNLENDEIWHTACNWWDIPRDFGHTDEDICFPVRLGVMLACKNPIMFDMYYKSDFESYYNHIVNGAPFGCREFHHAYRDFYWGKSFTEPEFLENINKLDTEVARLNEFQTVYPKMDLLIVYGAAAQNNWYPDHSARNVWDIDGSLHILQKCEQMWNAGYRCALAPDYAIEDGRITLNGDKINFNGYDFSHCLFLYPKYAKKETYAFLNRANACSAKIAVVGKSGVDFEGNEVLLTAPHFDAFDLQILEKIGCEKSAIESGCVYTDGSFSLVSKGILTGEATEFDFEIDGVRYTGQHTGLLAYRRGSFAFATSGSRLLADGVEIPLEYK